ncbi:MAG: glycerophosphodiester phosphodiesterase family protein [Gammaproteobacteria bacterium]
MAMTSPRDDDVHMLPPEVIAHRGNAAEFPENTREALASAIQLGARFVEFDVHLAADGIPVVTHDANLARCAGVDANVFDLPARILAQYAVGEPARFGSRFHNARLPLLADIVDLLQAHPGVRAFVELKRASLERHGRARMLDAVAQVLRPVIDRCVFISFDIQTVRMADADGLACGGVLRAYDEGEIADYARIAPRYLFCDVDKLPAAPAMLQPGPWQWAIYEVADAALAHALAARGAALVETMAVAALLAGLAAASR